MSLVFKDAFGNVTHADPIHLHALARLCHVDVELLSSRFRGTYRFLRPFDGLNIASCASCFAVFRTSKWGIAVIAN